ncbi:hypothetical protein DICVIV_01215 [Dictyocaulus viviparus]|uniref:DH domain-containing protein n=1 Tax=Dictyocaulus viviparus TaxID=29172 RepID=A0A0D8Y7B9_DICVI|nr:hypothetical protein DICVIV_01215 [Dictyocaulus viviparus]
MLDVVRERFRCSFQSLTKRNIDQQEAIWEIVSTEYRYIQVRSQKHARFVVLFYRIAKTWIFQVCEVLINLVLINLRVKFFRDINASRVFLNYTELFTVNVIFWRRAIQPLLEWSRQSHKPFDPVLLLNGFEDISEWSKCYIPFNLGHDDSHTYIQKKQKDNELFKEFVQWAESQESMRRQKLCDTLTTPMQRLTRYTLLLKVCRNENELFSTHQYCVTRNHSFFRPYSQIRLTIVNVLLCKLTTRLFSAMIDRTDAATQQLNFELNNNDLRLQMAEIMKSIDGYDAVDSDEFEKVMAFLKTP